MLDVQRGLPAVIGAKAGSDVTHYMHGPLGMFAQRNPDASWDWMLHDGLGSVRGVFDGTLQSGDKVTQPACRVVVAFIE
ncbi:MAG: hypothetical protein IPM16_02120 [Chloroflexi bacterium]|nr:hypothetical protein [Chloroflexota bacterium]